MYHHRSPVLRLQRSAILLSSFSYRKSVFSNPLYYTTLLAQYNSKNKHLVRNIKFGQQSPVCRINGKNLTLSVGSLGVFLLATEYDGCLEVS